MVWSVKVDMTGAQFDGYVGPDIISVEETTPDELFSDALGRALSVSPDFQSGFYGSVRESGAAFQLAIGEETLPVYAGPELTVGEMRRFLGNDEPTLRLAWGLGGNVDLVVETIWTLANLGLSLYSLRDAARHGINRVNRLIYADQWRFFEDWRDGGALTMPLEQAGRALNIWTLSEAERRLGATPEEASRFFQAIGYEARRDPWENRIWVDPDVPLPKGL